MAATPYEWPRLMLTKADLPGLGLVPISLQVYRAGAPQGPLFGFLAIHRFEKGPRRFVHGCGDHGLHSVGSSANFGSVGQA